MKIQLEDDYGEVLKIYQSESIPRIGDSVYFDTEDFYVKKVIWMIDSDTVVIILAEQQQLNKEIVKDVTEARLTKVNRAIVELNKKQAAMEKSSILLEEQISSVKNTVRTQLGKAPKHHES